MCVSYHMVVVVMTIKVCISSYGGGDDFMCVFYHMGMTACVYNMEVGLQ